MQRKHLFLIGLRGVGKTTVGRLLSDALGLPFQDTDWLIEQQAGKSIREIFDDDGEARFRELEHSALISLTSLEATVISVGGGMVLREDNRQHMKSTGWMVWLQGDSRVLAERLEADGRSYANRPRFTQGSWEVELNELAKQRGDLYRDLSDWVVNTDQQTPDQVCTVIRELWDARR